MPTPTGAGPVDSRRSPHARLATLPFRNVCITGGLWAERQKINRTVSLQHGYHMLEQSGNLQNLRLAAGLAKGEYRRPVFMDSDVHKWLEAVSYELAVSPNPELEQMASEIIALLAQAQASDGYLNSYYQVVKPDQRWTNLRDDHELYCAGHLFQAAVAHYRATGRSELLDIACRFADHIASVFGPGKRDGTPGHPEIEMALVEMFRVTGEQRYLDLAAFFVDRRGHGVIGGRSYHQDRVPVRDATIVKGHAVRQLYLTAGVTDLFLETGEQALFQAMLRQWHDMTGSKLAVTGGPGARHEGEAFGDSYELPNDRCYCETCASIASIMWNWRLLLATGQGRYADLIERTLYNGFLSGFSLDGQRYFYVNPLLSRGGIERPEWYGCACCPPNVMRLLGSLNHYLATADGAGLQLHLFAPAAIAADLDAGHVALRVETGYPWQGSVRVSVEEAGRGPWRLSLRVPAWCAQALLRVNGEPVEVKITEGYATIERRWQAGDTVELELPMAPRLTVAHPRVDATRASVAIERGPIVYCLEECDQEAGADVLDVEIDETAPLSEAWREDLLGGVMAIHAFGEAIDTRAWGGDLYRPFASRRDLPRRPVHLTAVPYYAWANRGPGAMRVWIPRRNVL